MTGLLSIRVGAFNRRPTTETNLTRSIDFEHYRHTT